MPDWISFSPRITSWWNNTVKPAFTQAAQLASSKTDGRYLGNNLILPSSVNSITTTANWFKNHTRIPDILAQDVASAGTGSASGIVSGSGSGASVSNAPSVNAISLEAAPITSAVSAISDPEIRSNAFNEMMSNSSHQREVKDLLSAGLNPVLSAKYGGAGSSAYQVIESSGSGSGSGGSGAAAAANGFLGMPMIKNPSKPWQIAYNLVVANGDRVLNLSQNSAKNFESAYQSALKVGEAITNSAK